MIERSPGGDPETKASSSPAPRGALTEEAALAARLERLGESLEARREAEETAKPRGRSSGFAQATKIASEFVAGVIVGGGIGWAVDRAFGVAPWGMIVFVLLGFAAGVLNVLRSEGVVSEATTRLSEPKRNSGASSDRSDG
ncbi:MAG: ATP F0F1 synthase subunit I [Phyllobacteriaceae bacterium]|nr:ATP F0F1 synthase subunit I [Phyllobacteriaceae bacterium]